MNIKIMWYFLKYYINLGDLGNSTMSQWTFSAYNGPKVFHPFRFQGGYISPPWIGPMQLHKIMSIF